MSLKEQIKQILKQREEETERAQQAAQAERAREEAIRKRRTEEVQALHQERIDKLNQAVEKSGLHSFMLEAQEATGGQLQTHQDHPTDETHADNLTWDTNKFIAASIDFQEKITIIGKETIILSKKQWSSNPRTIEAAILSAIRKPMLMTFSPHISSPDISTPDSWDK